MKHIELAVKNLPTKKTPGQMVSWRILPNFEIIDLSRYYTDASRGKEKVETIQAV